MGDDNANEATASCTEIDETGDQDGIFGISADILIPGRGDPIKNGVVVVKDDKIDWTGPESDLPQQYRHIVMTHVPVVMPGMMDAHTHFLGQDVVNSGFGDSSAGEFLPGAAALIGAVLVADLEATLMAGFTSVRECGGYAGYLSSAIDSGVLVGPTVYSAVGILSITGGHGDRHDVPLGLVADACAHGAPWVLCDGVVECTKRVRQMVRQGARVIKVCSTGGVLSLNDQPEDTQFSPEELRAIVDEAARGGRVVAAHAIGKRGIVAALEAGVRSIEHGTFLDEEVAALMKAKGAILCPTRHITESLGAEPDKLPPKLREKMLRMLDQSRASVKLAVREGVKIALGTDTYSSDRTNRCSHGTNAAELVWAVEAGMTPLQALEMGTATPPETLGPQAPKAGQLRVGYDADIIAVAKNPLEDVEVLTKPKNITHVWKEGKLVKSPSS